MRFLLFIGMLAFLPSALAAENVTYESLIDSVQDALRTRLDNGIVQEIDLVGRKIMVGGFNYFLGPPTETPPLKVRMLGKDYGSLQMLSVGMHVEVEYIKVGEHRIGFEITQIEQSDAS